MDWTIAVLSGFAGFLLGAVIFINVAQEVGREKVQKDCLIKQEFVVDSVKFKCEMVKPERDEHDDA